LELLRSIDLDEPEITPAKIARFAALLQDRLLNGTPEFRQILEQQIAAGNLEEERRAEAGTDLRETDGKLAELVQQAIAARDQLKHIDIRASQDGIVHELAYHTVGGVIPPGETMRWP